MTKTITKSEYEKFRYEASGPGGFPTAFASLGIEVVPDPVEEPTGDVIVLDVSGDLWIKRSTGWECNAERLYNYTWEGLYNIYSPLRIYRLEE